MKYCSAAACMNVSNTLSERSITQEYILFNSLCMKFLWNWRRGRANLGKKSESSLMELGELTGKGCENNLGVINPLHLNRWWAKTVWRFQNVRKSMWIFQMVYLTFVHFIRCQFYLKNKIELKTIWTLIRYIQIYFEMHQKLRWTNRWLDRWIGMW